MVADRELDMREFVRWGGLLTLSLLAHLFVFDLVTLQSHQISQIVPQKIRISLSALAAPKSESTSPPTITPKTAEPVSQPEPTSMPVQTPHLPVFEKTKTAIIKVVDTPVVKSHPNIEIAKPVLKITKKREEVVTPIPTPRLIVKKPVTTPKAPALKTAEVPKPKPIAEPATEPQKTTVKKVAEPQVIKTSSTTKSVADNTGNNVSNVIHEANYKKRTPPSYPRRAYDLGQQGVVTLAALIEPNGRTGSLKVEQSSGHRLLDKAAIAAVKKWEFEPLIQDGRKVSSWVRVPVKFVIN